MGALAVAIGGLAAAGCNTSIYYAAGQGAMQRGDPQGAVESYVAARKFERKRMSRSDRDQLLSAEATAMRAIIGPRIAAGCKLARHASRDQGVRALSTLVPIYLGEKGMLRRLSLEERGAVDRHVGACIQDAMKAALDYGGRAPAKIDKIIGLVGRIATLRKALELPTNDPIELKDGQPVIKRRADGTTADPLADATRRKRLAATLQPIAIEALAGIWGVTDALVTAGRPFEALDMGREAVAATGNGAEHLAVLKRKVAAWLDQRAQTVDGHPALQHAYRSIGRQLLISLMSAKERKRLAAKRPRAPIQWTPGRLQGADCQPEVIDNLRWRLKTNVASPHHAVVDVVLRQCSYDENLRTETERVGKRKVIKRKRRYHHTYTDYLQTWECELSNVVEARTCKVSGQGNKAAIACKAKTTLKRLCRPSAGPIESTKLVTRIKRKTRTKAFDRSVNHGRWRYTIDGTAQVHWQDRSVTVPFSVAIDHRAQWWKDKHGTQPHPGHTAASIRGEAVAEAVKRIHASAVSVYARQIHGETAAARSALRHGDTIGWAEHLLNAARMGQAPRTDEMHRIGGMLGIPAGHYELEMRGAGHTPRHRIKPHTVVAPLRGGDIALDDRRLFPMPRARRDRFVENLREIVQGPVVMPRKDESHYEVQTVMGPSPLDERRVVPRMIARANLFGWVGIGFGGDLEALGQGTRGWLGELSIGPTISDDFARIAVFGRVRQQRLLPRADKLGQPGDGPDKLDNLDAGLRISTGGPIGAFFEGAYNLGGIHEDPAMRYHPFTLGALVDIKVAYATAGLVYWWGDTSKMTWQGGIGLRL